MDGLSVRRNNDHVTQALIRGVGRQFYHSNFGPDSVLEDSELPWMPSSAKRSRCPRTRPVPRAVPHRVSPKAHLPTQSETSDPHNFAYNRADCDKDRDGESPEPLLFCCRRPFRNFQRPRSAEHHRASFPMRLGRIVGCST
jgi:hypothetical protein